MRIWKRWIAIAAIAAAAVPAVAQTKASPLVVDGNDWMNSSQPERRAFLVGVGNMIVAEEAYARKKNVASAPVSAAITKAVQNMKLGDIEARITRWYEANPGKRSMPVMGVVWSDIVRGGK